MDAMHSTLPAAPIMWPTTDLLAVIGMRAARGPSRVLMARVSVLSFGLVPVPWALM